jgi:DHA2 family methylenomycin A resistance protein-like MFS transporter
MQQLKSAHPTSSAAPGHHADHDADHPADHHAGHPAGALGPQPHARRLTLIAASLGFAVVQLDVSVVNVAIKSIGASLGGGVSSLQWVVNAYTIGLAAFILTAGAIGDRLGAKRVFIGGFGLFMLASMACGLAPSLTVLVGARAVQGIGAAVLVPSSLSLLHHSYPDPAGRARAVGLWLAGASAALSGGPLVGGVLIAALGWRSIFFINVPVALIGVYLTARAARETTRTVDRGFDVPGQISAVLTLTALAAATIEGGSRGFGDPLVLAGYGLALASGTIFVAVERRVAQPMLPLGMFASPTFSAATAIGFLVNVCFYGLIFVFSLLFQREQHLSPLQTGLALLPIMVAITASNLAAGRISAILGPRRLIAIGALLMGVACAGLLGVGGASDYAALAVQIGVLGLGAGLIVPAITSELLGSAERSRSGVAAGSLNTMRQTGSAVGVALFGSLIVGRGRFDSGLHTALAISIALVVAIVALTGVMRERAPRHGRR